jgi:hypothetical protein
MVRDYTPSPAPIVADAERVSKRAPRLHLVLEILGRHFLKDFGPFVAGYAGEVLV